MKQGQRSNNLGQNPQVFTLNPAMSLLINTLLGDANVEMFIAMSPSKHLQAARASDYKPKFGTRQTWFQNSLPPNTWVTLASHGTAHSAGLVYNVGKTIPQVKACYGRTFIPFTTFLCGRNTRGVTHWRLALPLPLPPAEGEMSYWMWVELIY